MTSHIPILVSISPNEAARPRGAKIRAAIEVDDRFELSGISGDLPFDLGFSVGGNCPEKCVQRDPKHCDAGHVTDCNQWTDKKIMHVEIKDFTGDGSTSDYLTSIIGGHLYQQSLAAREQGDLVAIAILGDDNDVGAAIRKAASHATGGRRVDPEKLVEYYRMVEGFEANCIASGILVWRLKTDPYKRMLLRVRKILEGGDLTGFVPRPAGNERSAVGLSIMAGKGVGTEKARAILSNYNVCLKPKTAFGDIDLENCRGIGPKLAAQIRGNIEVL